MKITKDQIQEIVNSKLYDHYQIDWDIIRHESKEYEGTQNDYLVDCFVELLEYFDDENDQEKMQELCYELANNNVDIYYHDLYRSVYAYSDYINDAISEGLVDMKNFELWRAIQAGQAKYREELYTTMMNDYIEYMEDNKIYLFTI